MATAEVSSSAKSITIDRSKHLNQEPNTGHNRWHPDVTPVIEVEPGEQVVLETRDALDGYLNAESTIADLAGLPIGAVHPLTGPVFVSGAKPGDLLEIEFVDIVPQPWAFSAISAGSAFTVNTQSRPIMPRNVHRPGSLFPSRSLRWRKLISRST